MVDKAFVGVLAVLHQRLGAYVTVGHALRVFFELAATLLATVRTGARAGGQHKVAVR